MASIKIMLNDKAEIERLAADPDVKIKIKKAIVDEVLKRTVKALNDEILDAISREVRSIVDPQTANELFDKSAWRCGPTLAAGVREAIRNHVKLDTRRIMAEELAGIDPRPAIVEALQRQLDRIKGIDVEKTVREAASEYVQTMMAKLGQDTGGGK